jgi:CheY-like chemotaxis protein
LHALLTAWGHTVEVAQDGVAGSALTLKLRPHVDIGLRGIDGYDVAARVRSSVRNGGPRLIAMTGFGRASDRLGATAAGFDAHIVKPVDADELRKMLASR